MVLKLKIKFNHLRFFVTLLLVTMLQACTLFRSVYVSVQSTEVLNKVSINFPIYTEAGGEVLAQEFSEALPNFIQHIEATHGGKLMTLPTIIVCISPACYKKFALNDFSYGETINDKRIIINGAFLKSEGIDPKQILLHELSHYYWFSLGIGFQPRWFEEGFADWVSSGGMERKVSSSAAIQAIVQGKANPPNFNSGLFNYVFIPIVPPDGNWSLFYKQSELFVKYLHKSDSVAFNQLILELHKTKNLEKAWLRVYTITLNKKWELFVQELQNNSTHF